MVTPDLLPKRALDSLQAALAEMTKNREIDLLRKLLESYSDELYQVSIPHKSIFIAAEKGDRRTVDFILQRAKSKAPFSLLDALFYYDEYLDNGLKGSISGMKFEMFKQFIDGPYPYTSLIGAIVKPFTCLIVRDLLNKNLTSWLQYAISNGNYLFNRRKALKIYVKRSNLKDGNPIKPSPENVQFLMHLPDDNYITIKSFISIMRYADHDILDHLARQFLDPFLIFEAQVQEHGLDGRKKRSVNKLIFELEALNHAIDMIHGYRSESYDHVIAALEKVKREFDLNQKLNPEVYYK